MACVVILPTPTAPAGRRIAVTIPLLSAGASFSGVIRTSVVLTLVMLLPAIDVAAADSLLPEWRVASGFAGSGDVTVYSAAWYAAGPRVLHARRLEFSVGLIDAPEKTRPIAFIGPVWRITKPHDGPFLDFSIGPALIGGSTIDGRELGGNFHFRSALALGIKFGRTVPWTIALRAEHISNGGFRDANPGLDLVGISFVSGFGGR